jgi:glycine dehydrogenase subunit 1
LPCGSRSRYPLGRDYPEYEDCLLIAITEQRSRAHIDQLADALHAATVAHQSALEEVGR